MNRNSYLQAQDHQKHNSSAACQWELKSTYRDGVYFDDTSWDAVVEPFVDTKDA